MTIEGLQILASTLYRDAEEDSPLFGNTGKKEWMANQIEEMIENHDPYLKDLLICEDTDEVIEKLDTLYDERNDRELATKLEDEETVIANPVMREDPVISREYKERVIDEKISNGRDKITDHRDDYDTDRDWLRDDYVTERPQQPEYISDEPEFVADEQQDYNEAPLIIEEEIIVVQTPHTKREDICIGELNEDKTCK